MGIRVLLAAVVGGIIIFVCGAAAHMATPLGHMGMEPMPSEDPVIATMNQSIPESGMYFFPGLDMTGKATPEEEEEWKSKLARGPWGLLIYHAEGGQPMSVSQLATELLSNIAAALLAAFIAIRVAGTYVSRVVTVALVGPLTWISISVSYWNWYGFPTAYAIAEFITETASWIVAAFVIAAIARPRSQPVSKSPPAYDIAP